MNITTNVSTLNWYQLFTDFSNYSLSSLILDLILIGVFTLAVIYGISKGFFKTVWSLVGWLVVFISAYLLAPMAGKFLLSIDAVKSIIYTNVGNKFIYQSIIGGRAVEKAAQSLGFIILVILLSVTIKLFLHFIDGLLSISPLGFLNRVAGMVIGIFLGIILTGVIGSCILPLSTALPEKSAASLYDAATHSKIIHLINNAKVELYKQK